MSACLRVCSWGWDASPIPLTAPDDSCAASLFIWTDATEPLVQLAQPLCSRARHCRVPFSLSVRRGSVGKPWASCAPSLNKLAWFSHRPENLAKCLIYKSQINLRLLSWGHVWVLCLFQPDKSGVVNVSPGFQTAKRTSIFKVWAFFFDTGGKDSQCSPIKCNLWFNHAYDVRSLKCIFHLLSCRSGTSHRRRVSLQSICWVQGQRPPGSSTEIQTPPILSGDLRYSWRDTDACTQTHRNSKLVASWTSFSEHIPEATLFLAMWEGNESEMDLCERIWQSPAWWILHRGCLL